MICIVGDERKLKAAISLGSRPAGTFMLRYREAIVGRGFDIIRVVSAPLNDTEKSWLKHLHTRLYPGGKILHDY